MRVSREEAEEMAKDVISRVQAVSVRTAGLQFDSTVPSHLDVTMRASTNLSVAVSLAHELNALVAISTYEVEAGPVEPEATGADQWTAQCTLHGQWNLVSSDDLTDAHAQAFALAVCAMTLHPYARAHLQSMVAAGGFTPFTLDLMPSLLAPDDDGTIDLELVTLIGTGANSNGGPTAHT